VLLDKFNSYIPAFKLGIGLCFVVILLVYAAMNLSKKLEWRKTELELSDKSNIR
jgi:hypothetical protein